MSEPLVAGDLAGFLRAIDRGEEFVTAFEDLLRELPPERSNRLMLLHREARGAWYARLRGSGGQALFVGNALSGTWVPLARNGFRVTLLDRDIERLRFAAARAAVHARGRVVQVVAGDGTRLPFTDLAFDLVVQEEGLPGVEGAAFAHAIDECRRVCRGELVLTAENRLAYKVSTGRRGDFRVAPPWTWLRRALAPPAGQRTLRGLRRALTADGFEPPRADALYPHARDFTHVAALDDAWPCLPLGPLERKNRIKLLGRSLGLFPVLTPSFLVIGARRDALPGATRLERILAALAERLGEPTPRVEHWTATRGNSAVILTGLEHFPAEADPALVDPRGRWALHLPMSVKEEYELGRHARFLPFLREHFPDHPCPELLFHGELEGVRLVVERRVEGLGAPQLSGDRSAAARLFADVARHYGALVTRGPRKLAERDLDELIDAKFELVGRYAAHPGTLARLERTRREVRERLRGLTVPLVFYHSDLRSKHVRVRADGSVVGYLDFGAAERSDLPYFDLLHLIVHERKHERDLPTASAWAIVREREELRAYERTALDSYAERLALPEEYRRAIELAYPVLVAAMAEKNWDYSRPFWLHRQFDY